MSTIFKPIREDEIEERKKKWIELQGWRGKYEWVGNFYEGLAVVMNQKGLYGYINKKGKEVIKCKYKWIWKFINGRARVGLNNEEYYINREGERL